jgi:quercetin dioxygenase-like cupin family protein
MNRIKSNVLICIVALGSLAAHAAEQAASGHAPSAPGETVAPRMTMALPNVPGKTFTTATVDFPPGAKAVPHRHGEAFVYAYVLSGSVRSQLDDSPAQVYRAGEEWCELPGAHHRLTENTSKTKPARLLVVFVAPEGAALKIPD